MFKSRGISEYIKKRGFKTLVQVTEITGVSRETLFYRYINRRKEFNCLLIGAFITQDELRKKQLDTMFKSGRRKWKPPTIEKLSEMIKLNGGIKEFSSILDKHPGTIYRWLKGKGNISYSDWELIKKDRGVENEA